MSDPLTPTAPGAGAEQPIAELRRLGEQLAQARRTAGISEEALTQRLRLAPRQLKALEEGDHTRLPEGVFVVALARRVAEALHADVEEALQAVRQSRLMQRGGPVVRPVAGDGSSALDSPSQETRSLAAPLASPESSNAESVDGGDANHGPTGPKRWPLAALAALLAAGGLALAWWVLSRPSPRGVPTVPTSAMAPARSTAGSTTTPAPNAPAPNAPAPDAPASATSPASPVAADSLRLQASEPSWLEVRDLAGRTLFEGTLTGEKRFPIGRGIEVIAGRPHAVRASVGTAPGVPLGGVADIRWKRFSVAGPLGASPPSPAPTP